MKKKTIVLLAGTLTVSMLLGAAATANAADANNPARSTVYAVQMLAQTASKSNANAPIGTWFDVDGDRLDEFDPTLGLDKEDTDYPDSETYKVSGTVQIHDVPEGWTVDCDMRVNASTGKRSAFYILKKGSTTYRWYFDGAKSIVHTVDELRGITLTLNGEAVDCDPTKDVEVHNVSPSDFIGYEGQPSNWTVTQGDFNENSVSGYQYVIHPTQSDTPAVTYRFFYDVPDPADELAGVTATLDDGSPVTGFDPLNEEDIFTIPSGHTVTLGNLPDGWTQSTGGNDRRTVITLTKDTGGSITYLFDVSDSYEWTYVVTQLSNMTAELADGTPVDGFGYRGGEWTLPEGSTGVNLKNVPDGWSIALVNEPSGAVDRYWLYTVTSPDNTIRVDYKFTVPHTYTVDELKNVTATADGNPVEGFTPTQTGTWQVPQGSTVHLEGLPSSWVLTHEDGTLVWTITAPDNSVSVIWTFEQEQSAPSKDDLRTVTATVDGTPVEGFDPVNGGTFQVPANTTSVDLAGIPEGWSAATMDDALGFTLTSEDGSITVEYIFQPEIALHTVSFDAQGGTPEPEPQQVTDGLAATEPEEPIREGYTFAGWYLDGKSFDFSTPVTGDVTLVAVWEKSEAPAPVFYTVTFDNGTGQPVTVNVQEGEPVQEPSVPEREGYAFTGWFLDGKLYDFSTPITDDITLVAGWKKSEEPEPVTTYTVSFRTNGGSQVEQQTVRDGEPAAKPADPTRDGYTFTGWLLDGAPYDFSQPITGDITLDAAWEQVAPVDELAGVTATVDGNPVEGFQPTDDGEYRIGEGQKVELSGVPEGWTVNRQETASGMTFTLSDGSRTVVYTFVTEKAGDEMETPDTPGKDDQSDQAESNPDEEEADGGQETSDDVSSDGVYGLASTGAAIGFAVAVLAVVTLLGAAIFMLRRRR